MLTSFLSNIKCTAPHSLLGNRSRSSSHLGVCSPACHLNLAGTTGTPPQRVYPSLEGESRQPNSCQSLVGKLIVGRECSQEIAVCKTTQYSPPLYSAHSKGTASGPVESRDNFIYLTVSFFIQEVCLPHTSLGTGCASVFAVTGVTL